MSITSIFVCFLTLRFLVHFQQKGQLIIFVGKTNISLRKPYNTTRRLFRSQKIFPNQELLNTTYQVYPYTIIHRDKGELRIHILCIYLFMNHLFDFYKFIST